MPLTSLARVMAWPEAQRMVASVHGGRLDQRGWQECSSTSGRNCVPERRIGPSSGPQPRAPTPAGLFSHRGPERHPQPTLPPGRRRWSERTRFRPVRL